MTRSQPEEIGHCHGQKCTGTRITAKAARIAQRKAEGIAVAIARNIRMSPLKVRRVIDLIRGKDYAEAVAILNFTPNIAAEPIRKVLCDPRRPTRKII